jgi:hypothetical protein
MSKLGKIVVLYKTHTWSTDIENFALKIYNDTIPNQIDFFILMHDENDELFDMVKSDKLKQIILKFKEAEIKNIYQSGFISMWHSNHWILMWFFRQNKDKYQFYWSIEYDVRISGNSYLIWNHQTKHDFLYPKGNSHVSNHVFEKLYTGNKLTQFEKMYGFLQLARYSTKALTYMDKCFESGENGQDEMITFSLLNRGKFSGSKQFLRNLIDGFWTAYNKYSDYNNELYLKSERQNLLKIYHPVK